MILFIIYTVASIRPPQSPLLGQTTSQGLPYDSKSIMNLFEWSIDGRGEILAVVPFSNAEETKYLGNFTIPTALDMLHINILYCGGNIGP